MKWKNCLFGFLSIFLISLGLTNWATLVFYFNEIGFWLIDKQKEAERAVSWSFGIISLIMYIKMKFFDTKMFTELQKTYGKHQFSQSLEIILELLQVLPPNEIIRKISLVSEIEVEMLKEMKNLQGILGINPEEDIIINLNRKESKQLTEKIGHLMILIEKRLDFHYFKNSMEKAINLKKIEEKLNPPKKDENLQIP